ncbi:hypothetical protein CPS_4038 [Colwellia psychrerythraea 34H]|uniref:Uncharacterized protein n=1 Tax=Colwellia psychrerythraea (strain 34H / ATCC BAA-681) TaxID=167879 RepID=Q47WX5_COLP3|nr:hypothetical protein CPS_4038 [Colwellia psychrerythraea 34H]
MGIPKKDTSMPKTDGTSLKRMRSATLENKMIDKLYSSSNDF